MSIIRCMMLSILVASALNSKAQTDTAFLKRAVTSLEKYASANPTEKVYLHLDRDAYMPGDTVWFKAYTVIGQKHELSALSGALYVKLLNAKDSLLQNITLNITAGITWGDMALPANLKSGDYHIIAYTNFMRNAGEDYFFKRHIKVNDTQTAIVVKKQKQVGKHDVQFFPEGGMLVNGLRSKLAIKSVNNKGQGEDIEGQVVDNNGKEVAVFKTQNLGMGVFAIMPEAGKSYKAKISTVNHEGFMVDLPKAVDDGFTIAINNSQADSLGIRIAASARLFDAKKGSDYYLLAQSGDSVYYSSAFKLSAQSYNTAIDKKRFPSGIARFTLFADNGEPLNERIAFIRHNDKLKLKLNTAANTFTTRQKVKVDLNASNASNGGATGSFSASVVNEDFAPTNEFAESTIFSNLLLTSDIKGNIEQPGYYFTNVNNNTEADMDILMLTQGYHRFEWKQVLGDNNTAPVFEPEKSLAIAGYVKTPGGKPVADTKVSLLTTAGGFFMLDTLTNTNGRFSFNLMPDESVKYVIQAKGKKNLVVTLDTLSAFTVNAIANTQVVVDTVKAKSAYQKQVTQQLKVSLDKRVIQLKEVVIKEKKDTFKDAFIHADNPDQVIIDFPKQPTGESLATFLSVRLKNINVKSSATGVNFYTYRALSKYPQPPPPMMIKLDGMVINPDIFPSLILNDIESAEVIRTTGKMDMTTGATEVLYLISRKYHGTPKTTTPDVVTYQSNGLYKAREFYSPKYETINESSSKPDLRTTVYWNPVVITENGKVSFEYYNADIKGTYKVTVEGIDADGNLGRAVYRYKVE